MSSNNVSSFSAYAELVSNPLDFLSCIRFLPALMLDSLSPRALQEHLSSFWRLSKPIMRESLLSFRSSRLLALLSAQHAQFEPIQQASRVSSRFLDLDLYSNLLFDYRSAILCCSLLILLSYILMKKVTASTRTTTTTCAINTPFDASQRRYQISRALSSFVLPTPLGKSRFSTSFLRPTISSALKNTNPMNVIEINLGLLFAGLLTEKLELRDRGIGNEGDGVSSSNPLDLLILGKLEVDGYQLKLKVESKIWAGVSRWVILAGYCGTSTTTAVTYAQPVQPESSLQLIQPIKIDLDLVCYPSLEATLKAFVSRIPSGGQGVVEFSVLAPHVKWLSIEFVLCAISFMHSNSNANAIPTPTPMLLSLTRVVDILSSACTSTSTSLRILSCTNSSSEYSLTLRQTAHDWDSGEDFRNACGEEAWIRKRSMMIWRAAILRVGWVQRWIAVVSN